MTVDVRPPAFDVPHGDGDGLPQRPTTLRDRYALTTGRVHLTGVQALVRLPLDQHRADRRRRACAPGATSRATRARRSPATTSSSPATATCSPSTTSSSRPGSTRSSPLTAVEGTQLAAATGSLTRDGVVGYWYGKAPGLDRATDALRHANLTGTHPRGGAVAFVGDDPAAKSSSVPCASEAALADMAVPVLYPADSQDVLDLGRHAVALSRASGLWTALKMVTAVADGSGTVDVDPDRVRPVVPDADDRRPRVRAHALGDAPAAAPRADRARPLPRPARDRPPLRRRQRPRPHRRPRTGADRRRRGRQELARPAPGPRHPRPGRRRARPPRRAPAARRHALAARARRSSTASPTASTRSSSSRRSARSSRPRSRSASTAAPARPPCTASGARTARRSSPSTATSTPTSSPAGSAGACSRTGRSRRWSPGATRRPAAAGSTCR